MAGSSELTGVDLLELDRCYCEGRRRRLAQPTDHYQDPKRPHAGCGHKMGWIDFRLQLYGDSEGIYKPVVRAWWEGTGFAGKCPNCGRWIHFTTRRMNPLTEEEAAELPQLPDDRHQVAQFA